MIYLPELYDISSIKKDREKNKLHCKIAGGHDLEKSKLGFWEKCNRCGRIFLKKH